MMYKCLCSNNDFSRSRLVSTPCRYRNKEIHNYMTVKEYLS